MCCVVLCCVVLCCAVSSNVRRQTPGAKFSNAVLLYVQVQKYGTRRSKNHVLHLSYVQHRKGEIVRSKNIGCPSCEIKMNNYFVVSWLQITGKIKKTITLLGLYVQHICDSKLTPTYNILWDYLSNRCSLNLSIPSISCYSKQKIARKGETTAISFKNHEDCSFSYNSSIVQKIIQNFETIPTVYRNRQKTIFLNNTFKPIATFEYDISTVTWY